MNQNLNYPNMHVSGICVEAGARRENFSFLFNTNERNNQKETSVYLHKKAMHKGWSESAVDILKSWSTIVIRHPLDIIPVLRIKAN